MDPKLLGIFLALAVLLVAVAHFTPRGRVFLAIGGAVLAGVVLVVDLATY
ncbi:MAG TPA: hypothetical protein VFG87_29045 [Amycolatopsis sp.]|nr:hypothetical protein [Amycolatopsis sp.]